MREKEFLVICKSGVHGSTFAFWMLHRLSPPFSLRYASYSLKPRLPVACHLVLSPPFLSFYQMVQNSVSKESGLLCLLNL